MNSFILKEINSDLQAEAEMAGVVTNVWRRIAPIPGGIEIDLGNEDYTTAKITAGKVEICNEQTETLFFRPITARPMGRIAQSGDVRVKTLKRYLNLDDASFFLLRAWLSYTIATPKKSGSKFVILVLNGGQGTGKSLVSKIISDLIDPSAIDLQVLPSSAKELAIASQQSHVVCYDNLRKLTTSISDTLCIASTGGAMNDRRLYTDSELENRTLHVALVLNGIHSVINQPDLAQRCLPLYLKPIDASKRQPEGALLASLENDMPEIRRGLFDLIAGVFTFLPTAKATNPERMVEFSTWLAAMEQFEGAPDGAHQALYSCVVSEGQAESLRDGLLGSTMLDFCECLEDTWQGTPAALLTKLNSLAEHSLVGPRDWPTNAIALSKRLQPMQAALLSQGIRIDFSRGQERKITIQKIRGGK